MLRMRFATLIIGFFAAITVVGQQSRQQMEDLYKDANAYFYFEDYEEALALYLRVYDYYTDNFNIDYRIGFCYLNIPGRKHQAMPYLERASKNISKRYSEQSIRETRAPVEALFYLGNAYFVNNQLEKAQQAYSEFLDRIRNERLYDIEYLNHQVNSIKRSQVIRSYPVNFLRNNLGPNINNHFPNYNPVVSGDGQTLAFTTKQRFYQAIYVARKEGDKWGTPQNITLDLVVDGNCTTLSLSYKGDELYLFKDVDHVGNIYVSNYKDGKWSPMSKLNDNINTLHYETHACVSSDGTKLFFTSNRAGGYGDLDIYVSERVHGGDWGPSKNLGPNINTRFNENTPFVTTDGNTLYFSSEGHNTMGGYDIFFSQNQNDGTWSKPVNLGYPINSTDDDLFFHPLGDGSKGLMALFSDDAFGETDIYQLEIFLPKYQRSIVSSSDYYERKDDLPRKTLIVDTLNLPGVALLDPSKQENLEYLDPEKRFRLFFEGKAYSLKDQSKLRETLIAKLETKPIHEQELIKPFEVLKDKIQKPEDDFKDLRGIDLLFPMGFDTIKSPEKAIKIPSDSSKTESVFSSAQLTEEQIKQLKIDEEWLTKLLVTIADKEIESIIPLSFNKTWHDPKTMHKLWATRFAHLADSLGYSKEYIVLFAQLMDILNEQYSEMHYRQLRKISTTSQIEEFFFKFQLLKRKASPGLAEILDYAVLTNPEITSFESLWNYLNTQRANEIEPYITELLNLFAESAIEDFYALSPQQKETVYQAIQKKHYTSGVKLLFGISLLVAIFILLLFYFKRKRNKDSI
jgi:hypothetical protein